MKAVLLWKDRLDIEEDLWTELVLWLVPVPVRGSEHHYKYRLALIDRGVCVLRYDNEAGKGDHMHLGEVEVAYSFTTIDALRRDFFTSIVAYQKRREKAWLA